MATDPLGATLLALARNAIARQFGARETAVEDHPALSEPGASFVTLTRENRLRGCIGSLESRRPLAEDVTENARAAAFRDPRFAPLAAAEFASMRVEVSVLDAPRPLEFTDKADALARLRPGEDGVILSFGGRRATFLPQVWESLPEARRFLAELKRKAGLPADFWDEGIALSRYGVRQWKEEAR